jgi:hypothetical protein
MPCSASNLRPYALSLLAFAGMLTLVLPQAAKAQQGIVTTPLVREVPLEAIESNRSAGIGILDPGRDGGLDFNLWQGSDGKLAEALLTALPTDTRIPGLRDAARRALASTGLPPQGVSDDFPLLRAEGLMRLGYFDEAARLAIAARPLNQQRAERLQATAQVLDGDSAGACETLRNADRNQTSENGFWDRLDLYCQLQDNNRGAVGFLVNLLREAGTASDNLLSLASALSAGNDTAPVLSNISTDQLDPIARPIEFALLVRAGLPVDAEAPLLWQRIRVSQLDPGFRNDPQALGSIVRLSKAGWLDLSQTHYLLERAGFVQDDYADPLGQLENLEQTASGETEATKQALKDKGVAQLMAAAETEGLDATKAQLIAAAWLRAKPVGGALAQQFDELFLTVTPGPDSAVIAGPAFMQLSTSGHLDKAGPWLRFAGNPSGPAVAQYVLRLSQQASGQTPTLGAGPGLEPLQPYAEAAAAGLGLKPAAAVLAAGLASTTAKDSTEASALSALLLAGEGKQAQGQVALSSLLLAGNRKLTDLPPETLLVLTRSLFRAGLEAEARSLAGQALLQQAEAANLDGIEAPEADEPGSEEPEATENEGQ